MSEIQFTQKTIAPAGRNKYGNYLSKGNVTKSVVTTTYAGNDTTTTIADTGGNQDTTTTDFYCMLAQTNATFNSVDLSQGATASTVVIAYKGYDKGYTYICDFDAVTATTDGDGNIVELVPPENMGVRNVPSGITVSFQNNGTSATTISFAADSLLTGNTGSIQIPVNVYKRKDNIPLPDDLYNWYEHKEDCEVVWLEWVWNVNRTSSTNYTLDLSNQTAQVNCDSAGTLYPNSIAVLGCSATTYYNGAIATGITYSVNVNSAFAAIGINSAVTNNVLVLTFNSGGTSQFYWNPNYPSLPIDIVASKDGQALATKTMTISRNYPGAGGTPAHTRYIVTDYDVVRYDPNTSAFTPSQVVGKVMLQVGDQLPVYDSSATIYQWYNDLETGATHAQGSITASTADGVASITFALKNSDDEYFEVEEVPVLSEGRNGTDGQPGTPGTPGEPGASGESAWYLTLSNDNASINCDSDGNILPLAVRPTCQAKLYHGNTRQATGIDYNVDYGGASGVTSGVSSDGILTLTFGSGFNFTGSTVSITISASTESALRDVKVMNVTKSYAGGSGDTPYIGANGNWWIGNTDTGVKAEGSDGDDGNTPYIGNNGNWWIGNTDTGVKAEGSDGEDAVSYWLQPSFGEVIYDRNTNVPSPTGITCAAYKQIGQGGVLPATDANITYIWQSRRSGSWSWPEQPYTGQTIDITSGTCESAKRLRFYLYVGSSQVDQEDVEILMDGLNGEDGQGRTGAAIRGPYDYAEHSASTRCWCAGTSSSTCDDCDKWIDVVLCGDTYYYCNTTYYGTLASHFPGYWTSGETFDFVAANLIMANNAKIKFLSGNEIYLMDGNNVTGGLAGGTGVTFWAGSDGPSDAPFQVDADGGMTATTGNVAGWDLTASGYSHTGGQGEDYLHSEINHTGIEFDASPAGNNQHFSAGLDGISFNTESVGLTGLEMQGEDMKIVFADSMIPNPPPGINTDMDITGHKNLGVAELENGLSVKTPVYVEDNMYTQVKVNASGTVTGYNTVVSSPFTGLKIAVITTGSTYSTYFTKSGGHWIFNGDLDTNIDSDDYGYMVQVTSSAVVSNWRGMGYPGIPSEWVGMWCACGSNGSSTSYFYRPTGIYGPNHSKKGDTIYFAV